MISRIELNAALILDPYFRMAWRMFHRLAKPFQGVLTQIYKKKCHCTVSESRLLTRAITNNQSNWTDQVLKVEKSFAKFNICHKSWVTFKMPLLWGTQKTSNILTALKCTCILI